MPCRRHTTQVQYKHTILTSNLSQPLSSLLYNLLSEQTFTSPLSTRLILAITLFLHPIQSSTHIPSFLRTQYPLSQYLSPIFPLFKTMPARKKMDLHIASIQSTTHKLQYLKLFSQITRLGKANSNTKAIAKVAVEQMKRIYAVSVTSLDWSIPRRG